MFRISAAKVSKLLAAREITASQLADDVSVHRDTIYAILNAPGGVSRRQEKTAHRIAEALGVSVDEIAADDDRRRRPNHSCDQPSAGPKGLSQWLLSFDAFIEDRTRDFVGRQFVLDAFDDYVSSVPSGYFVVSGVPGVGKSAFLAHFVKSRSLPVYHFNVALQSINTTRQFLGNICAKLIQSFELPYVELPDDFDHDGAWLNQLLLEASRSFGHREPLIVAIDALDEVEDTERRPLVNVLCLPPNLPSGIFCLVTTRPVDLRLQANNMKVFDFESDSSCNQKDVSEYVLARSHRTPLSVRLNEQRVGRNLFVDTLVRKSEGNFMYLHHVLGELERSDLRIEDAFELPQGLRAYYRGHWAKMMRSQAESAEATERIVCILGAAKDAISLEEIAEFAHMEAACVRRVLHCWREFLYEERSTEAIRYRVYHTAFRDFLKEEVDPGLKRYHRMIADTALAKVADRQRNADLQKRGRSRVR